MNSIISSTDPACLEEAVAVLRKGGLLVIPTDTVYGVAAALTHPGSVQRIFEVKKRSQDKPLPVLVQGLAQATRLGSFDEEAIEVARGSWPGPVTLVVASLTDVSFLGGDGTSIGLRAPDHPLALGILGATGPLAASSANLSGSETASGVAEIHRELGGAVDLYIDDGPHGAKPSRVISLLGPPTILR